MGNEDVIYQQQLFCGQCNWVLTVGAVCKNECPDCGITLMWREVEIDRVINPEREAG